MSMASFFELTAGIAPGPVPLDPTMGELYLGPT